MQIRTHDFRRSKIQSRMVAPINIESNITCHILAGESLLWYCCKCVDIIFLQCFFDNHQRHEIKRLSDVKEIVSDNLHSFLIVKENEISKTISHVKELVAFEMVDSEAEEQRMYRKIEQLVDKRKKEIEESAETTIRTTKTKYLLYRESIAKIAKRIEVAETFLSEFSNSDDLVEMVDRFRQIKLYARIKQFNAMLNDIEVTRATGNPKFESPENRVDIGFIYIDNTESEAKFDIEDGHKYFKNGASVNETTTDDMSAADRHIKDSEVHVSSENDNNADDEVSSDEVRVISSADSHMQSTGEYQSSVNDNNTDDVSSDEVREISSSVNHMKDTEEYVSS